MAIGIPMAQGGSGGSGDTDVVLSTTLNTLSSYNKYYAGIRLDFEKGTYSKVQITFTSLTNVSIYQTTGISGSVTGSGTYNITSTSTYCGVAITVTDTEQSANCTMICRFIK